MRLTIALILSVALTACTLSSPDLPDLTPNEDNVIFVTATFLPETAVALQSNTATPVPPTVPPTPEVDPCGVIAVSRNLRDRWLL